MSVEEQDSIYVIRYFHHGKPFRLNIHAKGREPSGKRLCRAV